MEFSSIYTRITDYHRDARYKEARYIKVPGTERHGMDSFAVFMFADLTTMFVIISQQITSCKLRSVSRRY